MEQHLQMMEANVRRAVQQYDQAEQRARPTWLFNVKNMGEKRNFAAWVSTDFPEYASARQQRDTAQAQYDQMLMRVKGEEASKIIEQREKGKREKEQKQQKDDEEKLEDPSKISAKDLAGVDSEHEDRFDEMNRDAEDARAFEERRRRDL